LKGSLDILRDSPSLGERDKASTKEARKDGPLDVVDRCDIVMAAKPREKRGLEDALNSFPRNYQGYAMPSA
jgi:hypothetical protein